MTTDTGTAPEPVAVPTSKRGYLLPGTIALVVLGTVAAVFGIVGLQTHYPTKLDGPTLATTLSEAIQVGARPAEANPPDVRCPPVEPVRRGLVFDCTLIRPDRPSETIRVSETSDRGSTSYRVLPAG